MIILHTCYNSFITKYFTRRKKVKNLLKVAVVVLLLTMAFVVNSCSSGLDEISSLQNENPELVETGKSSSSETARAVTSANTNKEEPLTLEFIKSGTIEITNPWSSLRYSINGGTLYLVSSNNSKVSIRVNAGDKVCLYAPFSDNAFKLMTINCTSDCYIYGNIMSLVTLNLDTYEWKPDYKSIDQAAAFCRLFYCNTHIKNHSSKKLRLPAETLYFDSYCEMFSGCSSLTIAPELPATTLSNNCYREMFANCTSLTTPPAKLPAKKLEYLCCFMMFENCTKLTSAPELPATQLDDHCYDGMFYGCSSLITAPKLPATQLAKSCYSSMFLFCSSLTTAPELPATQLAESCYSSMFFGCSSLTTAPELPATQLADSCYSSMFSNCTSLTKVPDLPATQLADYCYSSMFSGCSSLITASELPATTLADSCYSDMFYNCTSLIKAPDLPARTLTPECYRYMFWNCNKLKYIRCLATDLSASQCTENWMEYVPCDSERAFVKVANATWSRGCDGIPENWTIISDSSYVLKCFILLWINRILGLE